MKKLYTVLLLYPDTVACQYGEETYLAWVEAANAEQAIELAQQEVCESDALDECIQANEFLPLAVFKGHLHDLKP